MDEARVAVDGARWAAPSPVLDPEAIASAPTAATRHPIK